MAREPLRSRERGLGGDEESRRSAAADMAQQGALIRSVW